MPFSRFACFYRDSYIGTSYSCYAENFIDSFVINNNDSIFTRNFFWISSQNQFSLNILNARRNYKPSCLEKHIALCNYDWYSSCLKDNFFNGLLQCRTAYTRYDNNVHMCYSSRSKHLLTKTSDVLCNTFFLDYTYTIKRLF